MTAAIYARASRRFPIERQIEKCRASARFARRWVGEVFTDYAEEFVTCAARDQLLEGVSARRFDTVFVTHYARLSYLPDWQKAIRQHFVHHGVLLVPVYRFTLWPADDCPELRAARHEFIEAVNRASRLKVARDQEVAVALAKDRFRRTAETISDELRAEAEALQDRNAELAATLRRRGLM